VGRGRPRGDRPSLMGESPEGGAIGWERVRRVARLVGELREFGPGEAARRHLLDTLARDLGAPVGAAALCGESRPERASGLVDATLVGFASSTIQVFSGLTSEGCAFHPCLREAMRRTRDAAFDQVFTWHDDDLVARGDWERSPLVNDYARPAVRQEPLCCLPRPQSRAAHRAAPSRALLAIGRAPTTARTAAPERPSRARSSLTAPGTPMCPRTSPDNRCPSCNPCRACKAGRPWRGRRKFRCCRG